MIRMRATQRQVDALKKLEVLGYVLIKEPSQRDFWFWGKLRKQLNGRLAVGYDSWMKMLVVSGKVRVGGLYKKGDEYVVLVE